jgi:hypothetical protein
VAKMREEKEDFAVGFMPAYSQGRIRSSWDWLQAKRVAGGGKVGWSRRWASGGAIFLSKVPLVWLPCGPVVGFNDRVSPVHLGQPNPPFQN